MLKKLVCLTGVLVALAFIFTGLAVAQTPSPTATISEQHLTGPGSSTGIKLTIPNTLFYGGDGDPTNPSTDGLWANDNTFLGLSGSVYSPFIMRPLRVAKTCRRVLQGLNFEPQYSSLTSISRAHRAAVLSTRS